MPATERRKTRNNTQKETKSAKSAPSKGDAAFTHCWQREEDECQRKKNTLTPIGADNADAVPSRERPAVNVDKVARARLQAQVRDTDDGAAARCCARREAGTAGGSGGGAASSHGWRWSPPSQDARGGEKGRGEEGGRGGHGEAEDER